MQLLLRLCLIAFAVGLGVSVAYRMNTEALAVVVGVICGISASIPVALLVLYTIRQERNAEQAKAAAAPAPPQTPQQPQIIVVTPQGYGLPGGSGSVPGLPMAFNDRSRFNGLGGLVADDEETGGLYGLG